MISRNPDGSVSIETVEGDKKHLHIFSKRKVFLPDEEEDISALIGRPNTIRIGMTGYSSISEKDCADWGIREGAYEAACATLLRKVTKRILVQFPGAKIIYVHGASNIGIDRVIIQTAHQLGIPMAGFNCTEWAKYVTDDDDFPLYVASTPNQYSDAFIRNLDVLISAGGRLQALEHDILAAIRYNKRLVLMNVLRAISPIGGPPARGPKGEIVNATAAFEESLYMQSNSVQSNRADRFGELQDYLCEVIDHVGRQIFDPEIAFGN